MNIRIRFLQLVAFLPMVIHAQYEDLDYKGWKNAGIDGIVWPVYTEKTLHCDAPDCTDALQTLIDESSHPLIVNIPRGTFVFKSAINLPSNTVIRGAGSQHTKVIFDVPENSHGFTASAPVRSNQRLALDGRPTVGDSVLTFRSPNAVKVGDHLRMIYDDRPLMTRPWGRHTSGQLIRVARVNGNVVVVDAPFRLPYSSHLDTHVEQLHPVENVGIEHVHIVRRSKSDQQVNNIFFRGVYRGYVYGVRSDSCHYAHVDARTCRFIHVEKSHFNDAHNYGEGGKAYGVMLQMGTCDSRVTDNSFSHLRHAMILQAGANGNVFSFNYSTEVRASRNLFGMDFDHTLSGDMVVHGNYPYANLFEANRAHMGIMDNAHGRNGRGNTFYRNHVAPNGITITNPATLECVFIENYAEGLSFFLGARHRREGNSFDFRGEPRPLEQVESLGTDVFPKGITIDVLRAIGNGSPNNTPLPAQIRYDNNTFTVPTGTLLIHSEDD